MKISSVKIFFLFFFLIFLSALFHQISTHYFLKYINKNANEFNFFIFIIIGIIFGSFVYTIRFFGIYFYGKNVYFIDTEFIYSYLVFLLSFIYGVYILKIEIPIYTYVIGIFITLLFALNFVLDVIYKKTILE
jgi:hypothetical protein